MRIGTWNSQGDKFGDNRIHWLIRENRLDILCLQESGNISRLMNGTRSGDVYLSSWNGFTIVYYSWRNHCRCSMAVLVGGAFKIEAIHISHVQMPDRRTDELNIEEAGEDINGDESEDMDGDDELRTLLRPVMMVRVLNGNDPVWICNAHLPSGRPAFARKVAYRFMEAERNRHFILIGDMNTAPEAWKLPDGIGTVTPGGHTYPFYCPVRTLDYAITDLPLRPLGTCTPGTSDHLAAIFEL